jgi:hypothetical protein
MILLKTKRVFRFMEWFFLFAAQFSIGYISDMSSFGFPWVYEILDIFAPGRERKATTHTTGIKEHPGPIFRGRRASATHTMPGAHFLPHFFLPHFSPHQSVHVSEGIASHATKAASLLLRPPASSLAFSSNVDLPQFS